MPSRYIIAALVAVGIILSAAVAWLWADRQDDDIRIDLPEVHVNR